MSKKRRKKRRSRRKTVSRLPQQLLAGLGEAEALMQRKRWSEAAQVLTDLDRRYPDRVEVLTNLVNTYYELNDIRRYEAVCRRLLKITPNDPDLTLMLAGAYITNLRPALALRTFRRFLDRWPDHERADDARQTLAELEARIDQILVDMGLPGEDGLELAALHEEAQSLMEQGDYSQARRVEEQLLSRRPDFAPALNNLSQIHFVGGRVDQAIATAQRVLAFDPDNFHALSNLTRYLCLSGRVDEAKEWAERLKAVESEAVDVWVKKAEALSYLGDDQGVLDAFAGAEEAGHLKPSLGDPLLYHLAAVAAMRLGREDDARRHWRQASKLAPGLDLVRDNLADLRRPVGERHAPWAFSFANWVSEKAIRDLAAQLKSVPHQEEGAASRAAQRYLRQHPEIASLVPLLLDRGDPEGRGFALRLAQMAKTPEMLVALRDFALSQRGPDEMRMEAARVASEAGLMPAGPVRLWVQGKWREILLMGFELHSEPLWEHPPQVEKWLTEATSAVERGEADRAERLIQRALEVEPDAPDLLTNLAIACGLQGRQQEAEAILRQTLERHPDDVFARTALAHLCLIMGETDEAEALLEPLLSRQRFHFSEFGAFCDVQIELFLAQGNRDAARSWLDVWATVDPEHPAIRRWRKRLRKPSLLQRLFGRRPRRRRVKKKPRIAGYREGDVVRVRPGTVCPDAPELDISGWQGRVTDLTWAEDDTEPVIGLAWDSLSLRAMPAWFIEDSEHKGLDWSRIYLELDQIEPAEPRDTEQDVAQAQREIEASFWWFGIGPEGENIQAVVNSAADNTDEWQVMLAWEKHLRQSLRLPFEAEVDEFQERGPLQAGDRLTVLGIEDVDELYGILVSCRKGRQRYTFPLADLAAVDENSPNAQRIHEYRVWFANR